MKNILVPKSKTQIFEDINNLPLSQRIIAEFLFFLEISDKLSPKLIEDLLKQLYQKYKEVYQEITLSTSYENRKVGVTVNDSYPKAYQIYPILVPKRYLEQDPWKIEVEIKLRYYKRNSLSTTRNDFMTNTHRTIIITIYEKNDYFVEEHEFDHF